MDKYSNVNGIGRKLVRCPICRSTLYEISWNTTFFSGEAYEEDEGYEIEVRHKYSHCNKCGYYMREIDSDNHSLCRNEYHVGIAIMKNPIMAIKQMLVLKKNSNRTSFYQLYDHIENEPKIVRTIE